MSIELIEIKAKHQKRFTPEKKYQILKEWEKEGNGVTIAEKYQIHPNTLYGWRKALEKGAATFLIGKRVKKDPRIRELEKENQNLKEALSIQTQELMLLKKKMNLV